jgi:signal transduction histidine kinase
VGVDITEEREALVRARELERIVALGNLVSGLTHELRNPINGALLQLTLADRALARRRDEANQPITDAVAQAIAEVRRASGILDDFLVFARPQPIHLERADVVAVAARAIERSVRAAGVLVSIERHAEATAEIDASRIESAVHQLIANAIDAAATTDHVVLVRIVAAGNLVAIEIEDHGAGVISTDASMFEPFFTTKEGGTGLGLSIAQRVATDHGGSVEHERRDGATVFRLNLPIVGGVAS